MVSSDTMTVTIRLGLLAALAADARFGDPRRGHPVAAFGRAAGWWEARTWRDSRTAGLDYAAVCVGTPVAVGVALRHRRAALPIAVWACLGGTTLTRVADAMHRRLADGDLTAARELVSSLCGRDPQSLDATGIARATVESVAENTSDAGVAPLVWAAVAGVPGVLGYRAVNTLDAMVGYRTDRHLRFGWASARTDDLANLLPARLAALLACLLAPLVGGTPHGAWMAWRADAARHPSPNAGCVEAAFAGALGLQLGGPTVYGGRAEQRPSLGSGRSPEPADIARAAHLSRAIVVAAALLASVRIRRRQEEEQ